MTAFPVILSAPSGGGKTTIAHSLIEGRGDMGYSVSCTTRAPRPGERDGVDYHFLSAGEFIRARDAGEFAEWAEVHGRYYGTLRSEVEKVLRAGRHVLMDIDVQGARQFISAFPDTVLIFVLPPSAEVLRSRLLGRQSGNDEQLLLRLENARSELREASWYHYVVTNDNLDEAVAQIGEIIDVEGMRYNRQTGLEAGIELLVAQLEKEIHAISGGD